MKLFKLRRDKDITGVSGTGFVATGWEDQYGNIHLRWYGWAGGVSFFTSMANMLKVHGHGGSTVVETIYEDREFIGL